MSAIITDDKYEQTNYRLIKKVLFLTFDFCINDDGIFGEQGDAFVTRKTLAND